MLPLLTHTDHLCNRPSHVGFTRSRTPTIGLSVQRALKFNSILCSFAPDGQTTRRRSSRSQCIFAQRRGGRRWTQHSNHNHGSAQQRCSWAQNCSRSRRYRRSNARDGYACHIALLQTSTCSRVVVGAGRSWRRLGFHRQQIIVAEKRTTRRTILLWCIHDHGGWRRQVVGTLGPNSRNHDECAVFLPRSIAYHSCFAPPISVYSQKT